MHLRQIESRLQVKIKHRDNTFSVRGASVCVATAESVICCLFKMAKQQNKSISSRDVHLQLASAQTDQSPSSYPLPSDDVTIKLRKNIIHVRNPRQQEYLRRIHSNDINFAIGPAGTGKTYLAVVCALQALSEDRVDRVLLVRPAVEAGEKLGFLPGSIGEKIAPYLRPLFDALHEVLGLDQVDKLVDRGTIELAPLAYMRGRTLNESFVILDEAQNTTVEQMKMFLTRIGFGSKAVITGDITQIDLARDQRSGLKHAQQILEGIDGISFINFLPEDVVRHPLVQRIVEAYGHSDS